MSKSFEDAYRELAQSEAPDLWNRIEAGLTDKKETTSQSSSVTKKRILFFAGKYAGMAAAVLCAVILIPTVIWMNRAGFHEKAAADSASYAETAEVTEDVIEETKEITEAAWEETEEVTEAAWEETEEITEAAGGEAERSMEDAAEAAGGEAKEAVEAAVGEIPAEEAAVTEKNAAKTARKSDTEAGTGEALEPADGSLFPKTRVTVTEKEEIFLKYQEEKIGILYTASVQEEAPGGLSEGEEIRIFVPVTDSFLMNPGESFLLDLEYSEENGYFILP